VLGLAFGLASTDVNSAALSKFEPITPLQLSVSRADRVRMQSEPTPKFAGARQALSGYKFAADDGQNDLGRQLFPDANVTFPREPEMHGRPW